MNQLGLMFTRWIDGFDIMEGFILTPVRGFYARGYIITVIKLECVGNMHFYLKLFSQYIIIFVQL